MVKNGAFGAANPPSGYHPHVSSGSVLAEVYDYGHDGWATGTPPYMGDYTYMGSPFEGWELQFNGGRVQGFEILTGTLIYGGLLQVSPFNMIDYSNAAGSAIITHSGTFGQATARLSMITQTRVDTNASWVNISVKLKNTGPVTARGIYYMRGCDPDNDANWASGGMITINSITFQNDTAHRVLVSTRGHTGAHTYMGLGAKDSRAKCFIYGSWPLSSSIDLAAVYSGSFSATYTQGAHYDGDVGIGLVYNLDSLLPGDSTIFSYAYIFDSTAGLDHAVLTGTPYPADSFTSYIHRTCSGPEITLVTNSYAPGRRVRTYWGDGSADTANVIRGYGSGYVYANHIYGSSGTYTIKQVLDSGGTAIDSIVLSYVYVMCAQVPIGLYYDLNYSCHRDTTEPLIIQPSLIQIDSNGVHIDTLSVTSGFYYSAYGNPGDVYQFRVISLPPGSIVTCPVSGIITYTLTAGVYRDTFSYFGLNCSSTIDFDYAVHTSVRAARRSFRVDILVDNYMCNAVPATLDFYVSPKYQYGMTWRSPDSVFGNTLRWRIPLGLSSITSSQLHIYADYPTPTGLFATSGDTVFSKYTVSPLAGDVNPANNIVIRIDTVLASYDPNYMAVEPSGIITAGTRLRYTVGFENTGNDTAHNIYIMDTLSDNVDISSFRIIASSAVMYTSKITHLGHNILKFDFPRIDLLDSAHCTPCTGLLIYEIDSKTGLPGGTTIFNHAGIYFDDNPVVLTNTVEDIIATSGSLNLGITTTPQTHIFPNPGSTVITIKTSDYTSYTLTNAMGQEMMSQPLNGYTTSVDVASLSSGVYYITLRGRDGVKVEKWVKW